MFSFREDVRFEANTLLIRKWLLIYYITMKRFYFPEVAKNFNTDTKCILWKHYKLNVLIKSFVISRLGISKYRGSCLYTDSLC
jgi:hypothetical protein